MLLCASSLADGGAHELDWTSKQSGVEIASSIGDEAASRRGNAAVLQKTTCSESQQREVWTNSVRLFRDFCLSSLKSLGGVYSGPLGTPGKFRDGERWVLREGLMKERDGNNPVWTGQIETSAPGQHSIQAGQSPAQEKKKQCQSSGNEEESGQRFNSMPGPLTTSD